MRASTVVMWIFVGMFGVGLMAGQKKAATAHSMTGCLKKGTEANTYMLTDVAGAGSKTVEIVQSTADLTPHVGHKIEITGSMLSAKAAATAEGKKGTKAELKAEKGETHMRVTAVKMISATCP